MKRPVCMSCFAIKVVASIAFNSQKTCLLQIQSIIFYTKTLLLVKYSLEYGHNIKKTRSLC